MGSQVFDEIGIEEFVNGKIKNLPEKAQAFEIFIDNEDVVRIVIEYKDYIEESILVWHIQHRLPTYHKSFIQRVEFRKEIK
jgi:hypothetical protein